jgi:hypothetical protein
LDLTNLNEIPTIIYLPLTNKKLKAAKSSPKYLQLHEVDGDDYENQNEDNGSILTTTN